ncbi:hypothetical protein pb186bvf_018069 [Paramecium bursaria]
MDQEEPVVIPEQPKTYEEWIAIGKQNAQRNLGVAIESYEQASQLAEDKYESYFLIAQAYRINIGNVHMVRQFLAKALQFVNGRIDRYIKIANEYGWVYHWRPKEIHGWVKELDPNYDHDVPNKYDDYEIILMEYEDEVRLQYATRSIEKFIELSQDKVSDLIKIASKILKENKDSELVDQYFFRALQLQEDKFDVLIKIGDAYYSSKLYEKSLQYYNDARSLRTDIFQLHLNIIRVKLELQQYQEALDYSINLQKPEEKKVYIELGLIFGDYDQTFDQGQQYILKGVDLSQYKWEKQETLQYLIKYCSGTRINKALIQQAIKIDGNDSKLANAYADHMKNWDGTLEEKIDAFSRAIQINPQSEDYYHYLREAYIKLDKIQEGIDFLKGLNNPAIQSHFELGRLLLKNNQVEEAIKYLNLVIGLDKGENSQCKIVSMLHDHKYYAECIQICDEFQQFDQKCQSTYFYKAQSLVCLGKQEEAYPIFQKAQEISYSREVQELIEALKERINQMNRTMIIYQQYIMRTIINRLWFLCHFVHSLFLIYVYSFFA